MVGWVTKRATIPVDIWITASQGVVARFYLGWWRPSIQVSKCRLKSLISDASPSLCENFNVAEIEIDITVIYNENHHISQHICILTIFLLNLFKFWYFNEMTFMTHFYENVFIIIRKYYLKKWKILFAKGCDLNISNK